MAHSRKILERRTYSEDRYYALIKRQKAGTASFKELVELDEIVNRVPNLREKVLRENFEEFADDNNEPGNDVLTPEQQVINQTSLWEKLKNFVARIFVEQFYTVSMKH